jgi:predicted SAM-dependent methyltransferase
MLGREPGPAGVAAHLPALESGATSRQDLVQMIRGFDEFNRSPGFTGRTLGHSIHSGRCQFIRGLPRAERILDLGGTHLYSDEGAMVGLGYPYRFKELVIVDLPSEERHEIYRSSQRLTEVETRLGLVRYQYHSMTDLSGFEDSSFDLVYSGQSIEHVTSEEGAFVFAQVHRLLCPGGYFALDTPNARVTRLQQQEFIDPDHKVEYQLPELVEMATGAGYEVVEVKGLNYAGDSLGSGMFDADEVARYPGLFAEAADCYILCLLCRKPS